MAVIVQINLDIPFMTETLYRYPIIKNECRNDYYACS